MISHQAVTRRTDKPGLIICIYAQRPITIEPMLQVEDRTIRTNRKATVLVSGCVLLRGCHRSDF